MPTSVLLAVLAATGLFVLAPALVRRYDATERLTAERTSSSARVLSRRRRRRTVPGHAPVNPPRQTARTQVSRTQVSAAPVDADRSDAAPLPRAAARTASDTAAWWRARRRRVLAVLTGLFGAQIAGLLMVGPGFWVGVSLSGVLLVGYVALLREAVAGERRRRAAARRATAARQRLTHTVLRPVTRLAPASPPPAPLPAELPDAEPEPPPRAANM